MRSTSLLFVVLASWALPCAAQPPRVMNENGQGRVFQRWENDLWYVLAGPDYCAAGARLGSFRFAMEKYWWTGEVRLQVMSDRWLSLTPRAGSTTRLTFFVDGNLLATSGTATIVGNNQVGGFFFDVPRPAADRIPAMLASAEALEVQADGRTLGEYALDGAADAMEALSACVTLMRGTDRSDPFAPDR